ncbi:RidA family protein [Chitinophaga oryziterrae]|uniref:RidA family protein n=1 Tax=Chitinophaga oryziterrae TaxID=1031224 RepID=A0A6N8J7J4_9BACT|nr:RidA family protein [Chitinophaga oryziterrae]MVT41190.1 RidA family protein [Chitinophaga oryziterrae]
MQNQRRSVLKKMIAAVAGITGINAVAKAAGIPETTVKGNVIYEQDVPLFSSFKVHGNMVFIAGIGAHVEGDIKSHTEIVLKEMEVQLKKAGSSMEKVLKVSVFLHDLNDYKGMNEVYKGRFGSNPPVRTTVAVYGGVPGNSLVEMDCIAAL